MQEIFFSHSIYITALIFIALCVSLFYKKILSLNSTTPLPRYISYFVSINIIWNVCGLIGSLFFYGPGFSYPKQILFSIQALAWIQAGYCVYQIVCLYTNPRRTSFFRVWNIIGLGCVIAASLATLLNYEYFALLSNLEIFGFHPFTDNPISTTFAGLYILFDMPPIIATIFLFLRASLQSSDTNMTQTNKKLLISYVLLLLIFVTLEFILPLLTTNPSHNSSNRHFLFWIQCGHIFIALLSGQYFTSLSFKNKSAFWLMNKIVNQVNDGIIYYYSDGRIKSANAPAIQMFQTNKKSIESKYIQDLFPRDLEYFKETHYKNHKVSIKNEIHKLDIDIFQSILTMTTSEYLIRFSDLTNTLYYQQRIKNLNEQYVEYKQDLIRYQDRLVISQKRSEENKNFLYTLINSIPFQFWSKNEQGVYTMQNDQDKVKRGTRTTSFDDNSEITQSEQEARNKGETKTFTSYETPDGKIITQDESNALARDGKEYLIYDNLFIPIVSGTGPYKVIGLKIDITKQRKLEKERDMLREQKYIHSRLEELGTLCGAFAHDYNNILGSQLGFCDLAKESLDPSHPAYMFICEVRKAADRGKESLEQLLDTIRGNSQTTVKPIQFAPSLIIQDVVERLTQNLPKEIKIDSSDVDQEIKLTGIVASFDRIVMNIAKNGIQAMKKTGGTLTITLGKETLTEPLNTSFAPPVPPNSYAKIRITDTGSGMDAATIERIFSPFFTTKAPGEGLGLGLSSALRLINETKAYFTLQSTLGEGTTFNLYWVL